ncbi:tRNA-binding protein [Mycoplasmopsis mustelae]|uniref:tRNA-binding protein n=1 Tax=Mycoplasmopsis mustelae TaxID=171289 RepID=A0A4R7UCU7_9BACT|nr:hypothetical protein [Mycoplasmopsis mustelae]TDV24268.1 tRNA-binding protein [Mycoplasmopsis mustelae]
MIICNNLNTFFKNTSVIFVDCTFKPTKKIQIDDFLFFVDEKNNVVSINLLNNKALNISETQKFFALNSKQKQKLFDITIKNNLKISDKPKFIYGKILSRFPHPKSEKLFVLSVDIKQSNPIQIITNTLDSLPEKIVVLALPGSTTYDGTKILEGKLLDLDSYGMLTGYNTLGLKGDGLIFGKINDMGKDFKF